MVGPDEHSKSVQFADGTADRRPIITPHFSSMRNYCLSRLMAAHQVCNWCPGISGRRKLRQVQENTQFKPPDQSTEKS
ncbi:hypothetical protein M413DRAFT_449283 [Hebeloma cylindrosporum]|uniref:Uncharacterized protein n=1 Tax=Hebeloma cylindrosporum TaxID=76867 RepID=A0A0C2XE96_HEBCY|nr:hypothetical protein M413DRAFT_449283 [Hebeloma cylindrosporum h7]